VLSGSLKQALKSRLETLSSHGKKPILVVPTPYMARALAGQLGSGYLVQDLFTWAGKSSPDRREPNPLELFQIFREALAKSRKASRDEKEKGAAPAEDPRDEKDVALAKDALPYQWQLAQIWAKDWEEVLLGTSSLEEALQYWNNLSEHQQIEKLFSLFNDPPTWLELIPIPARSLENMQEFWNKFGFFQNSYLSLFSEKRLRFNEEALQELVAERKLNGALFLHLYSAYPLLEKLAREAPHRVGWKVDSLRKALPEVWGDFPSPSEAWDFPVQKPRKVELHTGSTLTLVLREAARHIATWLRSAPSEACAAIWCQPESEPLLRHFLQKEGVPSEALSPQAPTLWESTDIGRFLRPYLLRGLEGRLDAWPAPPALPTDPLPAEAWAHKLYDIARELEARSPLHWRFLHSLFQERIAVSEPFPPSVRLYVGQLTQLAGGHYDVLFLVDPPVEPLGPWARPSFWLASLRKRFYSPTQHNRLAWRLQSVLLWASQEVRIFRLADPTRIPPIEELLTYHQALGLQEEFAFDPTKSTSVAVAFMPEPRPIEDPPPHSHLRASLSPSRVSALFRCPRRFYWQSVLPQEGPPQEALLIGRLMHELVRRTAAGKTASSGPIKATLANLAYRGSRRRLFYRAARLLSPEERRLLRRTHSYRLLMPILAEASQPLLQALIRLLLPETYQPPQTPSALRWRHFKVEPLHTHRYHFYVEWPIPPSSPLPLDGRVDLLVEDPSAPQRVLLDFKQRLPRETDPVKTFQGLEEVLQALQTPSPFKPPSHYDEALFQVLSYAWYLNQVGKPVDKAVLVSLWWRPRRKASPLPQNGDTQPMVEVQLDASLQAKIEELWTGISSLFSKKGMKPADFPQTPDKEICRYCAFALLCDRLRA